MPSDGSTRTYPMGAHPWIARWLDWLTNHSRQVLALGVAFQLVVLIAMMVRPLMTLAAGDTILLRVIPVDPRDLFRGDYVILSYEISRPGWQGTNSWGANWERMRQMEGKVIYVLLELEQDGKHWRYSSYQFEPPAEGKHIRGTVAANGMVQFGIEQYFVQEGQGRVYEKAVLDKKLSAEVALDRNGSAQLKRLVIE